jgi:hypothetical protein
LFPERKYAGFRGDLLNFCSLVERYSAVKKNPAVPTLADIESKNITR